MDWELGTDGPKVILVAVDGSTTSLRAGSYAAGLARRQGARLVVGHVVHPPSMAMVPGASAALEATWEASREAVEQLRSEAEQGAAWHGIDVEFRTAEGNPYGELVKMAEEVRAELVVLGASTSPGHRVVGSLGARMIKAGKWPVTVVP
jgi:nucleotide-binding universal stress UspA family protein